MSSEYARICLSHNPPLVIDEDWRAGAQMLDAPPPPPGHPNCKIGVGRWSGALIELWLPTPYYDKDGDHAGEWYGVRWLISLPQVLDLLAERRPE